MTTPPIQNNWPNVKAKIKAKWSKLNDQEVESLKDNLDKVSAQIQKTYGITKDQAEKQFSDFKLTLQSMAASAKLIVRPLFQTLQALDHTSAPPDAVVAESEKNIKSGAV